MTNQRLTDGEVLVGASILASGILMVLTGSVRASLVPFVLVGIVLLVAVGVYCIKWQVRQRRRNHGKERG